MMSYLSLCNLIVDIYVTCWNDIYEELFSNKPYVQFFLEKEL